jgi:alanyl-tRNA synthetase
MVYVYASSGVKRVDCADILKRTITKFGGRGGGRADLAQGGAPDASRTKEILNEMLRCVKDSLKQEN